MSDTVAAPQKTDEVPQAEPLKDMWGKIEKASKQYPAVSNVVIEAEKHKLGSAFVSLYNHLATHVAYGEQSNSLSQAKEASRDLYLMPSICQMRIEIAEGLAKQLKTLYLMFDRQC